jgi:4-hydroxyphenylacetate 3-monooxygenase
MLTNAKSEAADTKATRTRPFTAQEYIESIRDGREIWIYGERVKDVTVHPAFRNTVRMLARLYDALHQEGRKNVLCIETDSGSGGYTHKFPQISRSIRTWFEWLQCPRPCQAHEAVVGRDGY